MSNKVEATFHGAPRVRMLSSCPNYFKGQVGTLGRASDKAPTVHWVDFGVERYGSTGCWCAPSEYEEIVQQSAAQLEAAR